MNLAPEVQFSPPLREPPPPMPASLEDKLAVMVWYLTEVRSLRRRADSEGLDSYLDDTEVAAWLTRMIKTGRTKNTRFLGG